jgi:3-dehydroquinate synthase
MERLTISKKGSELDFSYDIVWTDSFESLPAEIGRAGLRPARICVVTEDRVALLYLDAVKKALEPTGCEIVDVVLNAGEDHKNLFEVQRVYEYLIRGGFDRKDLLVALGGGVIGDMTGFAAATYLRGISFIQVPTTLLAEVDSSVGGKTGVDFDQFKNMVGAFYQPKLVYMNRAVLKTLPVEQLSSGMAEAVKSALIRDRSLFEFLESNSAGIMAGSPDCLQTVVRGCCRIKSEVVEQDPTENGLRAILNFGHTIGHAVEKLSDFTLLHGECVAIGMAAALEISEGRGMITTEEKDRIRSVIRAYGLPLSVSDGVTLHRRTNAVLPEMTAEDILRATKSDKKMENGRIRFILLDGIGRAVIDRSVTDDEIRSAAASVLA